MTDNEFQAWIKDVDQKIIAAHDTHIDRSPDWGRWEDEPLRGYLLRLVSQAIWQAGSAVDVVGFHIRDGLWRVSDRILDIAHPMPEPTEIDIAADQ